MNRLDDLQSRIARGKRLTNAERLERQGLIFNHAGKCGVIETGRQTRNVTPLGRASLMGAGVDIASAPYPN